MMKLSLSQESSIALACCLLLAGLGRTNGAEDSWTQYKIGGDAKAVGVVGENVWLLVGGALLAIDTSDTWISTMNLEDSTYSVATTNGEVIVAYQSGMLSVVETEHGDVTQSAATPHCEASTAAMADDLVAIACGREGVLSARIGAGTISDVRLTPLPRANAQIVSVNDGRIFVSGDVSGLVMIDLHTDEKTTEVSNTPVVPRGIVPFAQGYVALDAISGLRFYDLVDGVLIERAVVELSAACHHIVARAATIWLACIALSGHRGGLLAVTEAPGSPAGFSQTAYMRPLSTPNSVMLGVEHVYAWYFNGTIAMATEVRDETTLSEVAVAPARWFHAAVSPDVVYGLVGDGAAGIAAIPNPENQQMGWTAGKMLGQSSPRAVVTVGESAVVASQVSFGGGPLSRYALEAFSMDTDSIVQSDSLVLDGDPLAMATHGKIILVALVGPGDQNTLRASVLTSGKFGDMGSVFASSGRITDIASCGRHLILAENVYGPGAITGRILLGELLSDESASISFVVTDEWISPGGVQAVTCAADMAFVADSEGQVVARNANASAFGQEAWRVSASDIVDDLHYWNGEVFAALGGAGMRTWNRNGEEISNRCANPVSIATLGKTLVYAEGAVGVTLTTDATLAPNPHIYLPWTSTVW